MNTDLGRLAVDSQIDALDEPEPPLITQPVKRRQSWVRKVVREVVDMVVGCAVGLLMLWLFA